MSRDPATIQREIEQARDDLADALDKLAERGNPKRVVSRTRNAALELTRRPTGLMVLGTAAVLTVWIAARRLRRR